MSARFRASLGLAVAVVGLHCAAPRPAISPANATPEPTPADADGASLAQPAATPATATPPPPSSISPSTTPSSSNEGLREAIARAKGDIDRADRELQTAAGDCATACRALASMERATSHLCRIAGAADDRDRCDEAKTKVLLARDRVRTTCGSCPGGPTLERSAPIPFE
jgi:hypothetical protein